MVQRDPRTEGEWRAEPATIRGEGLALLYQGILTATVRIQSGKQPIPPDANLLQRQMEALLNEIEREAGRLGYRQQDISDAHYAVVAFLDEAIRRSDDPNRAQWTPLQGKLFSEVRAGEIVYERLKEIRSRRDSMDMAEVLEVYYLCFLLGYEGKYALGGRSELDRLMEDVRDQIIRIRGVQPMLSPEGVLPKAPKAAEPQKAWSDRWHQVALICAVGACFTWVLLKLILNAYTEGAIRDILAP